MQKKHVCTVNWPFFRARTPQLSLSLSLSLFRPGPGPIDDMFSCLPPPQNCDALFLGDERQTLHAIALLPQLDSAKSRGGARAKHN